ncbi:SLAP domain-containing protein [Exiguobacterium sp. s141]|uniref:SLAP domain-containing protein n=1 Tax=Exiguobacterium sp. s141 TaxID=2751240 RepID=UPI001BED331B|nr:SLAP domain-containing protein [Exiguobacterium sp. s141]
MFGLLKRKKVETIIRQDDERALRLVFDEGMDISKEDEYVFRYHATTLPPLADNQLSIELLSATKNPGGLSVVALFRNTVATEFSLDEIPVLLLNERREPLGQKMLSRMDLPSFEAMTSKPVYLDFFEEELFTDVDALDTESLQLAFQMNPTALLQDISDAERDAFPDVAWHRLKRMNVLSRPVAEGQFDLLLVHLDVTDTEIGASLLVRNGYLEQALQIPRLPLELMQRDEVVGRADATLNEPILPKHDYPLHVRFKRPEGDSDGPISIRIRS